jgi:hypothetical protein
MKPQHNRGFRQRSRCQNRKSFSRHATNNFSSLHKFATSAARVRFCNRDSPSLKINVSNHKISFVHTQLITEFEFAFRIPNPTSKIYESGNFPESTRSPIFNPHCSARPHPNPTALLLQPTSDIPQSNTHTRTRTPLRIAHSFLLLHHCLLLILHPMIRSPL